MFCSKCGEEIKADRFICEGCGKILKRPIPINAVLVIYMILAVIAIFVGLVFVSLPSFSGSKSGAENETASVLSYPFGLLVGITALLWGAIDLVVWWGLRKLKKWAGRLGIAECCLVIILGIFLPQLRSIFSFIIHILVIALIYYGWDSLL